LEQFMADREGEWMWRTATEMLDRAEKLHRQFFQLSRGHTQPSWEPPVDVFETAREVVVLTVLPGVTAERTSITIENGVLVIRGIRTFPSDLREAAILRLELPQGRYERRVALPPGRYEGARTVLLDGCLVIRLRKLEGRAP
jgi:HSP20 family molecular chaperone IbpA